MQLAPTRENAKNHQSREKAIFESLGIIDRLSYDAVSVPLGEVSVYFKFRVTSFDAFVSVRLNAKNKGCDLPPNGSNYHSSAVEGDFVSIGEFTWSENGSGFNKKFEKALEYCRRIADGDWEMIRPLVQENRSTSYSPGSGEWKTRFSCPEITTPDLAKK